MHPIKLGWNNASENGTLWIFVGKEREKDSQLM